MNSPKTAVAPAATVTGFKIDKPMCISPLEAADRPRTVKHPKSLLSLKLLSVSNSSSLPFTDEDNQSECCSSEYSDDGDDVELAGVPIIIRCVLHSTPRLISSLETRLDGAVWCAR